MSRAKNYIARKYKKYLSEDFPLHKSWFQNYIDFHLELMDIAEKYNEKIKDREEDDIKKEEKINEVISELNGKLKYFITNDSDNENKLNKGQVFLKTLWNATQLGATNLRQGKFGAKNMNKIIDEGKIIYEITASLLEEIKDKDYNFKEQSPDYIIQEDINKEKFNFSGHKQNLKKLKNTLDISRVSWSGLKRIYSLAYPGIFTTIINENLNKIVEDLGIDEEQDISGWDEKNIYLMKNLAIAIEENDLSKTEEDIINKHLAKKDKSLAKKVCRSMFYWCYYENLIEKIKIKKQKVFYGPPGTGKTYSAREEAEQVYDHWRTFLEREINNLNHDNEDLNLKFPEEIESDNFIELIQFHPSMSYEDFIEGIRPVPGSNSSTGGSKLEVVDGVFKKFCRRASRWSKILYNNFSDINGLEEQSITLLASKYLDESDDFQKEDELSSEMIEDIKEYVCEYLLEQKNKQKGIEFSQEEVQIWEIIFILSVWYYSDYSENKNELPEQKLLDYLPPYIFIVDEINRAELSRVLGELMYCLEYRGLTSGKVKTQFSYLLQNNNEDAVYYWDEEQGENYFFIPHNLFFYGTMNTLDRSVESFDFALRRRFDWQKVSASAKKLKGYLQKNKIEFNMKDENINDKDKNYDDKIDENINSIVEAYKNLNSEIEDDTYLGPEYSIGHTYLFDLLEILKYEDDLDEAMEEIWQNNISPLVEEYLRGLVQGSDLKEKKNKFKKAFLEDKEDED